MADRMIYQGGTDEIVEKKSRFIAHVFPVASEEEAQEHIDAVRKQYWDARHNCHAFVIGRQGQITRCSDDGEPSGTAGRPILEVITGAGLYNVLVIVTRYFGGTLLGTGGLVRAYSQATQAGIAASRIMEVHTGKKVTVQTDYNGVGKLLYLAGERDIPVLDTEYGEAVVMQMLVELDACDALVKQITEVTCGQAQISLSDPLDFAMLEGKPLLLEEE